MGVLGKDASALQRFTVATCVACFRVKLDRQHQPACAYLTDRISADAPEAIEEARALNIFIYGRYRGGLFRWPDRFF